MRRVVPLFLLVAVAVAAVAASDEKAPPPQHAAYTPATIQWSDAPPVLPPGARIAVLKGDPSQEGVFVLRLRVPAGYRIPPHWHPAFENVTVISGEAHLGMGDKFDTSMGETVPAGGFIWMAPMMHHYFWCEVDTVIQLHGIGPWQLYYLNPADDPRTVKK